MSEEVRSLTGLLLGGERICNRVNVKKLGGDFDTHVDVPAITLINAVDPDTENGAVCHSRGRDRSETEKDSRKAHYNERLPSGG